jgi:hypothetical protein
LKLHGCISGPNTGNVPGTARVILDRYEPDPQFGSFHCNLSSSIELELAAQADDVEGAVGMRTCGEHATEGD